MIIDNGEGIIDNERPVFRASTAVQERISFLLHKNKTTGLTIPENEELDGYEQIDAHLSYLNRVIYKPHSH